MNECIFNFINHFFCKTFEIALFFHYNRKWRFLVWKCLYYKVKNYIEHAYKN